MTTTTRHSTLPERGVKQPMEEVLRRRAEAEDAAGAVPTSKRKVFASEEERKASIRQYKAAWKARNKEKIAAYNATEHAKRLEKARKAKWRAGNPSHDKEWGAAYRATHEAKARRKEYVSENRERLYAQTAEWYAKNKERVAAYKRQYLTENRVACTHHAKMRRRLIGGQAIARVFFAEIVEIYERRPAGYEVDHIVPIKGRNVCGLHVPANLQYLLPVENKVKGNKFDAEREEAELLDRVRAVLADKNWRAQA